ncbi:MAG: DUF58 domain-containing protein [Vicinamibacterales bacterium]
MTSGREPSVGEPGGPGQARWLDPAVLARLATLELKARAIVEGFLSGLHRSPRRGFSVEFAEHRPYLPGDDLSCIDWKVYARSDRYYVRKHEQETNLDCRILLDVSGSMAYSSRPLSKLDYGAALAAALACLMTRQRDAVGLTTFDSQVRFILPPGGRPGHLRALIGALAKLEIGKQGDVAEPLNRIAEGIEKRGLVVVISDLLDDRERVVQGLKHIRFRGMEVIVFQVLDPDELTFPFDRARRFRDLETGEEVSVTPAAERERYLAEIRALVDFYRRELGVADIDYCLLDSSRPFDLALLSYLSTRRRSH